MTLAGILMVIDGVGWLGQSTRQACFSGNRCPTTRNGPICYHIKRRKYTQLNDRFLYFHILQSLAANAMEEEANNPLLEEGDPKAVQRFGNA